MKFPYLLRFALCTQGLTYTSTAVLSIVNVDLFLNLVGRPEVDHFQTLMTGTLFGAIGVGSLLAALQKNVPHAAVLIGGLAALATTILELIYLPQWTFFANNRFISPLWIDLPYEIFLSIELLRFSLGHSNWQLTNLIDIADLKNILFSSGIFFVLISFIASLIALVF